MEAGGSETSSVCTSVAGGPFDNLPAPPPTPPTPSPPPHSNPDENVRRHSVSTAKKSVRWSSGQTPAAPSERSSERLRQPSASMSRLLFFGLSGIFIIVAMEKSVFDLGSEYTIFEGVSRLAMPGFCVVFFSWRLTEFLRDNRGTKRTDITAFLLTCVFSEAALIVLAAGEEFFPVWFPGFVALVTVFAFGVLTSTSAGQVVVTVATVVAMRNMACAIFVTLPQTWRPLLGYAFVLVGILIANVSFPWSGFVKLTSELTDTREHEAVISDGKQAKIIDASYRKSSNPVLLNRRISLPVIQKSTGDTLNSHFLRKAESTIEQLLSSPGVPLHIHTQLKTINELLKMPDSQDDSIVHRRSKSIPLVSRSRSSVFSQFSSDLPYTISEDSTFAPKIIRRQVSFVGNGRTGRSSGIWLQNFFNSSHEPHNSSAGDWVNAEEDHRISTHSNKLQNGLQSDETICADSADPSSRLPGEGAQDIFPSNKSPSRRKSSSSSTGISFNEETEILGRNADDAISRNSEPDISEVESEVLKKLLAQDVLKQWDYPIFDLALESPDTLLSKVACKIFTELELMNTFEIPLKEFVNFFHAIERGYHDNPYHNRIHATDVLHAVYFMTTQPIHGFKRATPKEDHRPNSPTAAMLSANGFGDTMGANFLALELMAMLTAAALHDYDHPGRTNAFLITTCHPLAVLYNNRSVLENHHAAASWGLLISDPKYSWLANLNDAEFKRFRYLVIDEILVTDLVHHFTNVDDFKNRFLLSNNSQDHLTNGDVDGGVNWADEEDRLMVSRMVIKMADINGPCKPWQLHRQWTDRIVEEFYQQGDDETQMQLSVSPYMDRNRPQLAKLQESFITHLVMPLCEALDKVGLLPCYLPTDCDNDNIKIPFCPMMKHLSENEQEWKRVASIESADVQETC